MLSSTGFAATIPLAGESAEAAEQLASEIRRRAAVGETGPATDIARSLGIELRRHDSLPSGRRGIAIPGQQRIDIAESRYDAADEFSIAHEVVELHLPTRVEAHEELCDRAAAALLMPRERFLSSVGAAVFDLGRVRQEWPWASWHALAKRCADLCPGVAAAKWAKGSPVERRCARSPAKVTDAECDAVRMAFKLGRGQVCVGTHVALAWWLKGRGSSDFAVSLALPLPTSH